MQFNSENKNSTYTGPCKQQYKIKPMMPLTSNYAVAERQQTVPEIKSEGTP